MVDTPGYTDFGIEVSKILDSVEEAVLLCNAAQGVKAQTLSVFDKATGIGKLRGRGAGGRGGGVEERGGGGAGVPSWGL